MFKIWFLIFRFNNIWYEKSLVIAAALISRFKLQWLPTTEQFNVEAWLKAEFENEDHTNSNSQNESAEENNDKANNFFGDLMSISCLVWWTVKQFFTLQLWQ